MPAHWSIHSLPELSGCTRRQRRDLYRQRHHFMRLPAVVAGPGAAVLVIGGLLAASAALDKLLPPLGLAALAAAFPSGMCVGHLIDVSLFAACVRRALLGHCGACGYDLTGNVSGVCLECGAPTPIGAKAVTP